MAILGHVFVNAVNAVGDVKSQQINYKEEAEYSFDAKEHLKTMGFVRLESTGLLEHVRKE